VTEYYVPFVVVVVLKKAPGQAPGAEKETSDAKSD
jgi:hypothetical protein